jgi:glutathione S-transferase
MLKLYGVARSRASRNIWMLAELGVPCERVPVIQAYRLKPGGEAQLNTRSPEFLAVSASAAIPVLVDDGLVLTESLAINLYLARKFGGPLAPRDLAEDALMTASALHAATAIEPDALRLFYLHAEKRADTEDGRQTRESLMEKLDRPLSLVEGHLASQGHAVGGRFTVADVNLAEIMRYAQSDSELIARYPATRAWLEACQARPAFQEMMRQRLAEPA